MLTQFQCPIAVFIFTLAMAGCAGGQNVARDQYRTEEPPYSRKEAAKWWGETLDRLDPDFLAVLLDVSETHTQKGTTAICISSFDGMTNGGGCYHLDLRLPLPLPDAAAAKAKTRLVGWAAAGDQPCYRRSGSWWHWEGGKGCSNKRAEEIWQEAEQKYGWHLTVPLRSPSDTAPTIWLEAEKKYGWHR